MDKAKDISISVALCTYNGSRYLRDQLESINNQSIIPDELVIVDDCSTDQTNEIISSFTKDSTINIVYIRNEKNIGSTSNFEKCIKNCTGELIILSDQDDVWDINKIKIIVNKFSLDKKIGLVFSNAIIIDFEGNQGNSTLWKILKIDKNLIERIESGYVLEVLLKRYVITGATIAFKSKYVNDILPIPDKLVHDQWIAIIIGISSKIISINEKLIKYRVHSEQKIGITSRNTLLEKKSKIRSDLLLKLTLAINLEKRLNKLNYLNNYKKNIIYIEEVIKHLNNRLNMPKNIIERLKIIYKEYINNRYKKFSSGYKSIIIDLLVNY